MPDNKSNFIFLENKFILAITQGNIKYDQKIALSKIENEKNGTKTFSSIFYYEDKNKFYK